MISLEEKVNKLPQSPGVYLFKDRKGVVIYIGKASNLRNRVNSYFHRAEQKDLKTLTMLEKVNDIEVIITNTEKEAFILENNLIKEYRPRYNVKLRDDKNYPCLKLSIEEEFPTLSIVRRIQKDDSIYYGPYPSATSLKETLRLIRKIFPIRTCRNLKFSNSLRPCINYEMGRCLGPCCGLVDSAKYRDIVNQLRMFLEGKNKDLLEGLRNRMEEEAEKLNFELAAKIRDRIQHIEKVIEKQKVVSQDFVDEDVIGYHSRDHTIIVYSLFIRAGKILGGKGFSIPSAGLPEDEVIHSFINQYYREGKFIPEHILIPIEIPEQRLLEDHLTELSGKKVHIYVPLKGDKKRLIEMACENAEKYLPYSVTDEKDKEQLLELLREKLFLNRVPRMIEAFDISNLQGGFAVGSMVRFEDGEPAKDKYRHFKIKTVEGADDYAMMYEVLFRRYQRALEEHSLPDLILLDGGRGQLNVASEVLKELNIKEVDVISLAKERSLSNYRHRYIEKSGEKIFHPNYKEPFNFPKNSPIILFLDRIRDEAHRFAITYHKKIRKKETIKSELEDIPGIGKIRRNALLKFFGSIEKIREASEEDLISAPKMNKELAKKVYQFFHRS